MEALEIVRVRVEPEQRTAFLNGRSQVETALRQFPGYLSSELAEGTDGIWALVVRWTDGEAVKDAQRVTRELPVISGWLNLTAAVLSFDTVEIKRMDAISMTAAQEAGS